MARLSSILIRLPLAGALAIAAPVMAKPTTDGAAGARVLDELLACDSVTAAEERLACFDRTAKALRAARADRQLVVLDREDARQVKRKVFGFAAPRLNLFGGGDEPEVTELDATLSRAIEAGNGNYRYMLDDGSAWQTTEGVRGVPPRAGQPIRIKAGILGSYLATVGQGRSAKVRRIH